MMSSNYITFIQSFKEQPNTNCSKLQLSNSQGKFSPLPTGVSALRWEGTRREIFRQASQNNTKTSKKKKTHKFIYHIWSFFLHCNFVCTVNFRNKRTFQSSTFSYPFRKWLTQSLGTPGSFSINEKNKWTVLRKQHYYVIATKCVMIYWIYRVLPPKLSTNLRYLDWKSTEF